MVLLTGGNGCVCIEDGTVGHGWTGGRQYERDCNSIMTTTNEMNNPKFKNGAAFSFIIPPFPLFFLFSFSVYFNLLRSSHTAQPTEYLGYVTEDIPLNIELDEQTETGYF